MVPFSSVLLYVCLPGAVQPKAILPGVPQGQLAIRSLCPSPGNGEQLGLCSLHAAPK